MVPTGTESKIKWKTIYLLVNYHTFYAVCFGVLRFYTYPPWLTGFISFFPPNFLFCFVPSRQFGFWPTFSVEAKVLTVINVDNWLKFVGSFSNGSALTYRSGEPWPGSACELVVVMSNEKNKSSYWSVLNNIESILPGSASGEETANYRTKCRANVWVIWEW